MIAFARTATSTSDWVTAVAGVAGDPIGNGLSGSLVYPSGLSNLSDDVSPVLGGVSVFVSTAYGGGGGGGAAALRPSPDTGAGGLQEALDRAHLSAHPPWGRMPRDIDRRSRMSRPMRVQNARSGGT